MPSPLCKDKHLCPFSKWFLRVFLLPMNCFLFLLICWISVLLPLWLSDQKAVKRCLLPKQKGQELFCPDLWALHSIRLNQDKAKNTFTSVLGSCSSVLLFPACEKYSTNWNHFLLETDEEVHNLISPYISKQITTTSFSRELSEQVAIFWTPFRKGYLIIANMLSKNDLLHPVSSFKWISPQSAYETFVLATVVGELFAIKRSISITSFH